MKAIFFKLLFAGGVSVSGSLLFATAFSSLIVMNVRMSMFFSMSVLFLWTLLCLGLVRGFLKTQVDHPVVGSKSSSNHWRPGFFITASALFATISSVLGMFTGNSIGHEPIFETLIGMVLGHFLGLSFSLFVAGRIHEGKEFRKEFRHP